MGLWKDEENVSSGLLEDCPEVEAPCYAFL